MLDFPSTGLQIGQTFPDPPLWMWDGEKWTGLPSDDVFETIGEPPPDGEVYGRSLDVGETDGEWIDIYYQNNMRVFEVNGIFDPLSIPKGCTAIKVTVTGGGGGAGSAYTDGTNYYWGVAGGGGGTAISVLRVVDIGADPIPITVGQGGAGAALNGGNGGTGGTTSFGTFLSATGGTGGAQVQASQQNGGAGGNGVGGQLNFPGANGTRWHGLNQWPYLISEGGMSGAGMGAAANLHTQAGVKYGGGACCGFHGMNPQPAGAAGVCIVEFL